MNVQQVATPIQARIGRPAVGQTLVSNSGDGSN